MANLVNSYLCTTELDSENFKLLIESSYDGIMLADKEGTILLANKSYARMLGLTREMLINKNMRDLLQTGIMKESVALMVLEEGKPITITHRNLPGGNVLVTGNPVFNEKGKIEQVVVNVRDMTEIYKLQEELEKAQEMELLYYRQIRTDQADQLYSGPIAVSHAMRQVLSLALKVSPVDVTVLILGESGVGKEVIARYIHNHSSRRNGPFIPINCGAIPEPLLESELFGYVGGAFTGALKTGKMGLFEAAQNGTIFLDEIGELPLNLQVKLLRVLEAHEVQRIGSATTIPIDTRIIAATHRDLDEMVSRGEFRDDLYYRLNVVQVSIPPLRERPEDIKPLAMHFLKEFNMQYHESKRITLEVLKLMEIYSWPGNIRELRNAIEHMIVVSWEEYLGVGDLPLFHKKYKNELPPVLVSTIVPMSEAIVEVEKQLLKNALQEYNSYRKIALALGINHSTVIRKVKKYGLEKNV